MMAFKEENRSVLKGLGFYFVTMTLNYFSAKALGLIGSGL